jgi:hypothetical protein
MEKPKILETPDISGLMRICQEYMDFVDNDEEYYEDNDYNQYIFEEAMKSLFGEKVFDFINERQD